MRSWISGSSVVSIIIISWIIVVGVAGCCICIRSFVVAGAVVVVVGIRVIEVIVGITVIRIESTMVTIIIIIVIIIVIIITIFDSLFFIIIIISSVIIVIAVR